jgi:hypothetical protein
MSKFAYFSFGKGAPKAVLRRNNNYKIFIIASEGMERLTLRTHADPLGVRWMGRWRACGRVEGRF